MQEFKVQGMTCAHCVSAVTRAITEADPQARVQVELAAGRVEVDSTLTAQSLIELIESEGYVATRA